MALLGTWRWFGQTSLTSASPTGISFGCDWPAKKRVGIGCVGAESERQLSKSAAPKADGRREAADRVPASESNSPLLKSAVGCIGALGIQRPALLRFPGQAESAMSTKRSSLWVQAPSRACTDMPCTKAP